MPGETDLETLLRSMRPVLRDGEFVFCTTTAPPAPVTPLGRFTEDEGVTLILRRADADGAGLAYDHVWRMITLTVHSSLAAVGLLAAVTARLAAAGISVNAVSAFHHDHLFVPTARAAEALGVLTVLTVRTELAEPGP
jgi:hypothetical protein